MISTTREPPPIAASSSAANPAIRVRHLTKRYGAARVVDDVSFTIPRGQVVGLLGPNGAGKTTVMKMLLGLVRSTSGDVEMLGQPAHRVLGRVGAMIESPALYGRMTARQNLVQQSLGLGIRPDADHIDEVLALVDLLDRADDQPRRFSLGMRQRLGVAIALVGRPELVILDEPSNGLDPAGIREMRDLLRRLPARGVTALVSSHQLGEVQKACDHLLILGDGRLIVEGTTDSILAEATDGVVEIDVAPSERAPAAVALASAGHRLGAETHGAIRVLPDPGLDGAQLNRVLVEAGIYASRLAPQDIQLEQVFLDLTTPTDEEQS